MDFARKILNKYGWKEGDGLGKNNDGISKPLRASMKFDNAGLGSDQAASDFNNHWWERVFNEAAGNVDVKVNENGVNVELKNKDNSVEISTKGYSLKKLKKAKEERNTNDNRYDNFLQSATLTKSGDEIENPHKIAVADISVTKYKTLTDEELFRACGGRTAHKGARHGLKLSGKLSRIEQQEQELLAKLEAQKNKSNESYCKDKSKKYKDTIHNDQGEAEDRVVLDRGFSFACTPENISTSCKKKKNKASNLVKEQSNDKLKKNKRKLREAKTHLSLDMNSTDVPKKKRKEINSIPEDERMKNPKKSKSKDMQIVVSREEIANLHTEDGSDLNEEKEKKLKHDENNGKSKKNKSKRTQDESNMDTAAELETTTTGRKKTKGKYTLKYIDEDAEKEPKQKNAKTK